MDQNNHNCTVTIDQMRMYLSKSLSKVNVNNNKINGIMAEISFRDYIAHLGFGQRVSEGGWIVRNESRNDMSFGQNTLVFFPEVIQPDMVYTPQRILPEPRRPLHTICATFHQIGIRSYFCSPVFYRENGNVKIKWHATELGRPDSQGYKQFPECVEGFNIRKRNYNFLRYNNDASGIPEHAVPVEFSKESVRVEFQNHFYSEISDVDGIFWGKEKTYPVEIKEKTKAKDGSIGYYFGIDIGPFVKLAYYAAKRGNLYSMFVVREIDNEQDRHLINWRYITFEKLAQYASWQFRSGGKSMTGSPSATVRIPADKFDVLDEAALKKL